MNVNHDALASFARSHHGVFDLAALERAGFHPQAIRRRVRSGRWRRLHRGVFVEAGTPPSNEMLAQAAVFADRSLVLSDLTAIWALRLRFDDDPGFDATSTSTIEVCVAPGGSNRLDNVIVHRRELARAEITRRRGWPITTVERTIADVASAMAQSTFESLVENALLDRRTTRGRLFEQLEAVTARGRPGVALFRRTLAALDAEVAESSLERTFLRLVRAEGFRPPTGQARFAWLGSERARVDFWFADLRLIVELDGRSFHARSASFERDRRRDLSAAAEGIRTIRLTAQQLRQPDAECLGSLRRLLGSP